jgi:hypothetical protein
MPKLAVQVSGKQVVFRTPWDSSDEMDFDRNNLAKAAALVQSRCGAA